MIASAASGDPDATPLSPQDKATGPTAQIFIKILKKLIRKGGQGVIHAKGAKSGN